MEGKNNETMLTVMQIATRLNVNPRTVYRMLEEGEMPHYTIRGQKRVKQEDFQTWLNHQRKEGTK